MEQYRPYQFLDKDTAMKQIRRKRLEGVAFVTVISFVILALIYCAFYAGRLFPLVKP